MANLVLGILITLAVSTSTFADVNSCKPPTKKKPPNQEHIALAGEYAIYGLLSNNAYSDGRNKFSIPEYWVPIDAVSTESGLYYDLYEKKKGGVLSEVVIAFRGTQGFKDWINGNLSNKQYDDALKHIKKVVNSYSDFNVPIIATGHSLGGGLAMFASYQEKGITGVGFNSSPRYHSKNHKEKNTRVILFESGDPTRILGNLIFPWRWQWLGIKPKIKYLEYDFSTGLSHGSYPLTMALLFYGGKVNTELEEILIDNCDT